MHNARLPRCKVRMLQGGLTADDEAVVRPIFWNTNPLARSGHLSIDSRENNSQCYQVADSTNNASRTHSHFGLQECANERRYSSHSPCELRKDSRRPFLKTPSDAENERSRAAKFKSYKGNGKLQVPV